MAGISSTNQVNLGQWNTLTVHRNDWNGWIQLNDGPQEKGRSRVRTVFDVVVPQQSLLELDVLFKT